MSAKDVIEAPFGKGKKMSPKGARNAIVARKTIQEINVTILDRLKFFFASFLSNFVTTVNNFLLFLFLLSSKTSSSLCLTRGALRLHLSQTS
jgi:hypothetical protein